MEKVMGCEKKGVEWEIILIMFKVYNNEVLRYLIFFNEIVL